MTGKSEFRGGWRERLSALRNVLGFAAIFQSGSRYEF
jgi:hypothetical protein